MRIKYFDLTREYRSINKNIDKKIKEVLNNGNFILGEELEKFEKEWANYLGVKYAIGVGSGTDALFLSLKVLGIGEGDEVILPSFTFIATALAVSYTGATPIFADINQDTINVDPQDIERKITSRTKAIIPVHLYGNPADMEKIMNIAKKNNLFVIEDACQGHGGKYFEKKLGSIGDIGCFSFYPTKNLGCYGDGGIVVTNSIKIAKNVRMLRNYGQEKKYYSKRLGYNSRLDEVQAGILRIKLKYLDSWNKKRKKIVNYYRKNINNPNFAFQKISEESTSSNYVFCIKIKKRNKFENYLIQNEIGYLIHYPVPIHLQKPYKNNKIKLRMSEKIAKQVITLPLYPNLSLKEQKYIVKKLNKFKI